MSENTVPLDGETQKKRVVRRFILRQRYIY